MKRALIMFVLIALVGFASALNAARPLNDVAPGVHPGEPSGDALGDELFDIDVSTPTGSDMVLAVEYVDGYFYLTAAGPPNMVYVLDQDYQLVDSFSQGTSTQWGFRDLAWDGNYLYASDSTTIRAFTTDGTMVPASNISGPEDPCRALAYDPETDHFWVANFASSIYEIDRSGSIINEYSNSYSIYGLAWDNVSDGGPFLWAFEQDTNSIRQFNPSTGTYTGVRIETDFNPYYNEFCGGLTFIDDWGASDGSAILVGIMQAEPDQLLGYEVIEEVWPTLNSGFTNTPPTVDGNIEASEWADAVAEEYVGTTFTLNFKFMGDTQYLYGAIEIEGDTTLSGSDSLMIYFDNDNNNAFPTACDENTTDGLYLMVYDTATDSFLMEYQSLWDNASTITVCDTVVSPPGLTAAVALHTNVMWEFAIDYTAGEMYGEMGEKIGMGIRVYSDVNDAPTYIDLWPATLDVEDQATYGDFKYHQCGGCLIDDYCWDSGTPNPDNECEVCNPAAADDAWSNRDGFVCGDDGEYCNGNEVCEGGACTGHSGDPCGDDGIWCNGADSCDEANDTCVHEYNDTNPRCPDDGLWCTGEEFCAELLDACAVKNVPCPDGECDEENDECTGADDDVVDDDTVDDDVTDDDTTADDDVSDDDDDTTTGGDDDDDDDSGCGC